LKVLYRNGQEHLSTDLLHEHLNSLQQEVVTTTEGPLIVLAGAGSGKTRCIIHRAAWLIHEKKVPPWNILIVTFTNKAAGELKERLESILHFPVSSLWVGTFHSTCLRILRFEHKHISYSSSFSVYDDDDQKALLKRILKQFNLDSQKYPVAKLLSTISRYKNKLLLPGEITYQQGKYYKDGDYFKVFLNVYTEYQDQLLLNQAMDFDDILMWTAKLLESSAQVRKKYQQLFKYVMIDEYQDTNFAQFKIVHLIASEHSNICVVGDDDQAIYSWRGATIRNILEFEKDYVEVKKVRLEQNYRSTSSILNLANSLIKHNSRRHVKELWSEVGAGEKPILSVYDDETDEADKTIEHIIKLHKQGIPWQQCAVLYRTNAQSRVFEYACLDKKVPYSIVGSVFFYQRKEIKDLLAYLKVLANNRDNESLLRIINEPPRGIGHVSLSKLINFAAVKNIVLFKALSMASEVSDLQQSAQSRIIEFSKSLDNWHKMSQKKPVLTVVKAIIEDLHLIENYQNSHDPKEISRAENLAEFVSAVSEFTEKYVQDNDKPPLLADYLPFISLQTDLDQLSDNKDTVRLMTLHNAKGLEFSSVFIVGLEQDLLPHRMSMESNEEIEEERRLLYVGITRAKTKLHFSYVKFRRIYDTYYYARPSMFLKEIDRDCLAGFTDSDAGYAAPSPRKKTKSPISSLNRTFKIGQVVKHSEYGLGIVIGIDGEGLATRLTISFKNGKIAKIISTFVDTDDC